MTEKKKPASHTGRVSFYPAELRKGEVLRLFKHSFIRFYFYICSDKGATAIEYSLIAAGIAVAISVLVFAFGEQMRALIESLSGILTSASG